MAAPIRGATTRQTPARSFGAKMKQQILIQLAEWIRATAGERGLLVPVSGGTRNRTGDVFGTFSLASRVATYYPIVSLWKSEVLDLCGLIGVPEEIIASSHQADPLCGRTELMAEIGVERIDRFLKVKEGELPADELTILPADHLRYLDETYQRGQYKRNLPIR